MADILSSTARIVTSMRNVRLARAYSVEDACDGQGCIIDEPCQDPRPPEAFFEQLESAERALVECLTILTAEVNIQHDPAPWHA